MGLNKPEVERFLAGGHGAEFHLVMIAEHLMSPWFSWGLFSDWSMGFALPSAQCSCRQQRDGAGREHAGENAIVERAGPLLYDFFVQVFWKKVAQFGMERLKAEVERLRTFTEDTRRKCVSRAEVPPGELRTCCARGRRRRLLSWDMRCRGTCRCRIRGAFG